MATIWIAATTYMVILYPVRSIIGSAEKHPVILPIQGSEFMRDLMSGVKAYLPAAFL